MGRASLPIVSLLLALAAGLAACMPSPVCGDEPACVDGEHCTDGACVPAETSARVTVASFSARPERIAAGGASTLSWTTRNAAACALSPSFGAVPRSGSAEVRPAATTSWTLSCEGPGGPATAEVTVRVEGTDAGPSDGGTLVDAALTDANEPLDASLADAGGSDGGRGDGGRGDGGAGDGGPEAGPDAGEGGVAPVVVFGSVELLQAPPATVSGSAASSGAVLFRERQGVPVEEWLLADSTLPASYGPGQELAHTDPRVQIVPGHVLDSWLLHVENPSSTVPLEGTLRFAREVVAVSWRSSTLEDLDGVFAAPGSVYPSGSDRSYALWDDDSFVLEPDRRTLRFSTLGTDGDELRILVDSGSGERPMAQTWTLNLLPAGPLDLRLDRYEPEDHGVLLDEGEHTLGAELPLDLTAPGRYAEGVALTPGTLPAGTPVRSWLVHFDPQPNDAGVTSFVGVVTFVRPVLGIVMASAPLNGSDAVLGRGDVQYPVSYTNRGVEPGLGDEVWWSADGRSVRLEVSVPAGGNGLDELRVVTEP